MVRVKVRQEDMRDLMGMDTNVSQLSEGAWPDVGKGDIISRGQEY
jgi:hypothetical protein